MRPIFGGEDVAFHKAFVRLNDIVCVPRERIEFVPCDREILWQTRDAAQRVRKADAVAGCARACREAHPILRGVELRFEEVGADRYEFCEEAVCCGNPGMTARRQRGFGGSCLGPRA